jgi:hypothetical protein
MVCIRKLHSSELELRKTEIYGILNMMRGWRKLDRSKIDFKDALKELYKRYDFHVYNGGAASLFLGFIEFEDYVEGNINEFKKNPRKYGDPRAPRALYPDEGLYALGLALSVAEAKRLGEKVKVEEAEAALYAAAAAVQEASTVECVAALLEMFKPLGELAPHYHVRLASLASGLPELGEKAVREIVGAVDGALQEHGEKLEGKAWPLAEAVRADSNLLTGHAEYFR